MSGEMPEGWRAMPFSKAVAINPKRQLPKNGPVPFLDMATLPLNGADVSVLTTREVGSGGSKFQSGDTLFARITPCAENGKLGFVQSTDGGQVAQGSTEFIVMAGRDGLTLPEYVRYLAGWTEVRDQAIDLMEGTSGRQRVPNWAFDEIEVLIPPLDEQRRIAEVLRSVDEAIAASKAVERAVSVVFHRRRQELIEQARGSSSEVAVAAALRKNRGEKLTKLQTEQYDVTGRYPIVDQGARFICGYTDDEAALWPYDLPVVVFGDHTRILKFVDFPFAIGADGTQCLTPTAGIRPRYLYYALQSLDLRAEGYARHFKLLKEKTIPTPTPDEQIAIEEELFSIETVGSEARQSTLKLEAMKIALSSDLLSGRVRVPA